MSSLAGEELAPDVIRGVRAADGRVGSPKTGPPGPISAEGLRLASPSLPTVPELYARTAPGE